jgi:Ca-activated chloride channel family protein
MSTAAMAIMLAAAPLAIGQAPPDRVLARASHVIVPQARGFALEAEDAGITIEGVRARVEILGGVARTTLDVGLHNPGHRRAEAVLLLPVPDGAAVAEFLFDGSATEPTASLLPADEARRTYDAIVARVRDPALLEFAGYNLVRSSVFPVEPRGEQRVRVVYEHLLAADGPRLDYVLPRSESLDRRVPWDVEVEIRDEVPISMVYSPTHDLVSERLDARTMRVALAEHARTEPGHLMLSFLRETNGLVVSSFAYPDPSVGGGYFLLLAGLPATVEDDANRARREVTLVLDRSGSMAGGKLDQVRSAALQIIEGLAPAEHFNIIDYAQTVARFEPAPVPATAANVAQARVYLRGLRPTGGTNIHDALLEALRQPTSEGMLPIVLFLTDGLATIGRTSEPEIRRLVETGNPNRRRVFTLGVGSDVNVPLLDRIADATRAVSTYVLPDEDVELTVSRVFRRLYGPVLTDLELATRGSSGALDTRRVREVMPVTLPDVFDGDHVVVLGQYRGDDPFRIEFSGRYLGAERAFGFAFDPARATTTNAFVPRLWASRRIAYLVDEIRQAGAPSAGTPAVVGASLFDDPRFEEIANEILRLSTTFGVLTEYTSFLATEGTDLGDWDGLVVGCTTQLDRKAVRTRSGQAAVNQALNYNHQKAQSVLNPRNAYWDASLDRVDVTNVQQVCDRAFFRRGDRWIDSRLVAANDTRPPDEVVAFGSERHIVLLRELLRERRQGVLSLDGKIELVHEGRRILIENEK